MKKLAVILTVALILTLAGCGGAATPTTTAGTTTANTTAATTQPTTKAAEMDRTYNALVDISGMSVDGGADTLAGGKAEDVIKALDVPIFTAVFNVVGGGNDFATNFNSSANVEGFWFIMFDALTHNVTDDSLKNTGTQFEIPEDVVQAYAQAWFYDMPSKLPDVPASLHSAISYDAARKLYVFEMGDGIYPSVTATVVSSDEADGVGDVITLMLDTVYGMDEDWLPVIVRLAKGGLPDVGWALYDVTVAAAGESEDGLYENAEHGFSIVIPEGFEIQEDENAISLKSSDAQLDIFWQSMDDSSIFDAYEYEKEFFGYHIMYDYCDDSYYTILMEMEDGQSGGPSNMYAVYGCQNDGLMMRLVFEYSFTEHEQYFLLFQFMTGEIGGPALADDAITAVDAAVAQSLS